MVHMTAKKQVGGLGPAKSGTEHFWSMQVSSWALIVLVPLFVFTFGPALGESHVEVVIYFARPFPALVAALTLVVAWLHFKGGVQVLIEDYTHGAARKAALIATVCLSYGAAAAGVFALARLAL